MSSSIWNRPGLNRIAYRAGTFSSFFTAMKTRLSSANYPGLSTLHKRDAADWTIALFDGWAAIGDVLTFYQERIANEGYLRTATERLSILELGRTVGYPLRPGVAATAYLAYTMDSTADSTIPVGTLVQSTPAQGQLPQAFETSDDLHAKGVWNNLGVRLTKPQDIVFSKFSSLASGQTKRLYFKGTNLNLHPDDVLLLVQKDTSGPGAAPQTAPVQIASVTLDKPNSRTRVEVTQLAKPVAAAAAPISAAPIARTPPPAAAPVPATAAPPPASQSTRLLDAYQSVQAGLLEPPAPHPTGAVDLQRTVSETFATDHEALVKALAVMHPQLKMTLLPALTQATAAPAATVDVYVFRIKALPFGANAPRELVGFTENADTSGDGTTQTPHYREWQLEDDELPQRLWLDRVYPALAPHTYILINGPGETTPVVAKIQAIHQMGRAKYGLSASTALLRLDAPWHKPRDTSPAPRPGLARTPPPPPEPTIAFLRETNVFAQPEQLTLADLEITQPVGNAAIMLDGLYDGLEPGRWLIVAGVRTDVPGAPAAELMMLKTSAHTVDQRLPNDTLHTQVTFSNPLAYTYDRTSLKIYGNVVRATNGQTWKETLGSGSGSGTMQRFTLKQKLLTYVPSSSSASGVTTTLQVSVSGVPWTEFASFDAMGPNDRGYVTRTDNSMFTSVMFGDGVHGARLPTGVENVRAIYRAGIGVAGNVDAGQLTLLASRPLGVRAVTNPNLASGGADPENTDQGRNNAPLATAALDRIVAVADYASVARTFAGVAKAFTKELSGTPPLVHVTIAGAGDATLTDSSALVTNLTAILLALGDKQAAVVVKPRGLILLVLSAQVALETGAQWALVDPAIRVALLDRFGFDRRDLAQDVYLSEVIAAIQSVDGVSSVVVKVFDGISDISDLAALSDATGPPKPKVIANPPRPGPDGGIAAQLAIFEPSLPEAIVLREQTS